MLNLISFGSFFLHLNCCFGTHSLVFILKLFEPSHEPLFSFIMVRLSASENYNRKYWKGRFQFLKIQNWLLPENSLFSMTPQKCFLESISWNPMSSNSKWYAMINDTCDMKCSCTWCQMMLHEMSDCVDQRRLLRSKKEKLSTEWKSNIKMESGTQTMHKSDVLNTNRKYFAKECSHAKAVDFNKKKLDF